MIAHGRGVLNSSAMLMRLGAVELHLHGWTPRGVTNVSFKHTQLPALRERPTPSPRRKGNTKPDSKKQRQPQDPEGRCTPTPSRIVDSNPPPWVWFCIAIWAGATFSLSPCCVVLPFSSLSLFLWAVPPFLVGGAAFSILFQVALGFPSSFSVTLGVGVGQPKLHEGRRRKGNSP